MARPSLRFGKWHWIFFIACGLVVAAMFLARNGKPISEPAGPSLANASKFDSWLAPLPPSTPLPAPSIATVPAPTQVTSRPVTDRSILYEMFDPPTTAEAALKQAVQLQTEYYADTEFLPRVEIIYRLADASTPQSRGVLSRLFFSEKDVELRVEMVNALPFVDSGDLNLSLPILQEALKAGQPRELREAGLDTIQSLNDPKTLPLLNLLINDPDEEIRETAVRTIEYYKEVLDLDAR
jgi:hypothetical protein